MYINVHYKNTILTICILKIQLVQGETNASSEFAQCSVQIKESSMIL